ncbi:hypothetical protein BCR33DRAFT_789990 [Rhizoclosmatium globosum]|uniref:Uncharacterized protein n=1 Tax=Rhizoclosmatium globosum TaxID=329046 RepID=A0A1Y2BQ12_9FUNG|nr:hypothetical protein BCR33DRAFT_789990 [Rhizoclosmatium globosum]|eukprot:ORY36822.1 hypothetical protein BCR33DRAFT_789990 [Rhizoclosmatium globosum]
MNPPFKIEESRFYTQPTASASDDIYLRAMGGTLTEDAETAQTLLATKYVFDAKKWLAYFKKAETQSTKAALRCVIQAGTVFSVVCGRYSTSLKQEVRLCKSRLLQSIVDTRLHCLNDLNEGNNIPESEITCTDSESLLPTMAQSAIMGSMLANNPEIFKIIVVEADALRVATELKRIFRRSSLTMIPINSAVPGGFYRKGGPTQEEEVCRRTNLWDCLQDPYDYCNRGLKLESYASIKSSGSTMNLVTMRKWKYPVSDTSSIYVPEVTIFRETEDEGYAFMDIPSSTSCICIPPVIVHDHQYIETHKSSSQLPKITSSIKGNLVWNGKYGNKRVEPKMNQKYAALYARKIEMVLKVAVKENQRVLVLGALGCGTHCTPPTHAAEIFLSLIKKVDPTGEKFDLIVFAIQDDSNSFKAHNPNGNIMPFANVLTSGVVTSFSTLLQQPAINESEFEFELRCKPRRTPPSTKDILLAPKPIMKKTLSDGNSNASLYTNKSMEISRETVVESNESLKKDSQGPHIKVTFSPLSDSSSSLNALTLSPASVVELKKSYDEGFHPLELTAGAGTFSPSKGWQSERFCIYPQYIILRFSVGECKVLKIQILSHHYKIASKLEFFVGTKRNISSAGSDLSYFSASSSQTRGGADVDDGIRFLRLGFVTLGDNSSSEFKARELKSIPVNETGEFLKIVFHKNYINTLNLYNQVGLMAVTITGEYDPTLVLAKSVTQQSKTVLGLDPLVSDNVNTASNEFSISTYKDQTLVKIINAAIQAKKEAVKDENFRLANTLKLLVELGKKAADEVSKLLLLKAKSIELEDYELAEDAKSDIDQIKDALETKITDLGLKRTPDDKIVPIEPSASQPQHPPIETAATTDDLPKAALLEKLRQEVVEAAEKLNQEQRQLEETLRRQEQEEELRRKLPAQNNEVVKETPIAENVLPPIPQIEPKPKRKKLPALERNNESTPILPNLSGYTLPPSGSQADLTLASDLNSLGEPEKLTDEQKEKYAVLIQVYGNFLASCLLSRQFKLRERAIEDVINRVEAWCTNNKATKKTKKDIEKPEVAPTEKVQEKIRLDWLREVPAPDVDKETFIEATFMAIERGLDDSRERAITLSLTLWELLSRTCVSREISKLLVFRHLEILFPILLAKSGHMNQRVKQGCLDMVLLLAKAYHTIPHSVMKFILKLPKPTATPRYVISRLDALHLVIMKLGVDDMKQLDNAGSGLNIKSAMMFAEHHLHNKTTEIREAAVKVIVDLCLLVENDELIFSYLANIKHQTMHIVQTRLELARHGLEVKTGSMESLAAVSSTNLLPNDSTSLIATEAGVISKQSSESELVQNLKQELDSLKGLVQEKAVATDASVVTSASSVPAKKVSKKATAANTKTLSRPQTKAGKQSDRAASKVTEETKMGQVSATAVQEQEKTVPKKEETVSRPVISPVIENEIMEAKASKLSKHKRMSYPKVLVQSQDHDRFGDCEQQKRKDSDKIKLTLTEERLANAWNRTCIFCGEKNPDFTDEQLDIHYWRDCPMLCPCPLCHLIVEIPLLTVHMVEECDNKKLVKQCSRCKETVMTTEFQLHVERQTCLPASIIPGVSRCPQCHLDIPHGESGWKSHLLQGDGCKGSKREKKEVSQEKAEDTNEAAVSLEVKDAAAVKAEDVKRDEVLNNKAKGKVSFKKTAPVSRMKNK